MRRAFSTLDTISGTRISHLGKVARAVQSATYSMWMLKRENIIHRCKRICVYEYITCAQLKSPRQTAKKPFFSGLHVLVKGENHSNSQTALSRIFHLHNAHSSQLSSTQSSS